MLLKSLPLRVASPLFEGNPEVKFLNQSGHHALFVILKLLQLFPAVLRINEPIMLSALYGNPSRLEDVVVPKGLDLWPEHLVIKLYALYCLLQLQCVI